MEGWSFLTEYLRLRQAQIRAAGRLPGTAVQCLAAIGHGDGICTTHVTAAPLVPPHYHDQHSRRHDNN